MKNTKKELFKVIVAGTRTFKDYDYLKETLDKILSKRLPIRVVYYETKEIHSFRKEVK